MMSFLSFLFASYIADLELKKLATQKSQQSQPKKKKSVLSNQNKEDGQPSRILLDNNCSTQGKHHRTNEGLVPFCISKGRVKGLAIHPTWQQ